MNDKEKLEQAKNSLERVIEFDPKKLEQKDKLGEDLSFSEAIGPAAQVIELFKQIPLDQLKTLPDAHLTKVQAQSDALYKMLDDIMRFNIDEIEGNVKNKRDSLIKTLSTSYQNFFNELNQIIAYLSTRIHDFSQLQNEGRAAIQQIRDEASRIADGMKVDSENARQILEDVRKMAAEQGVSQQALYFKEESESHASQAKFWRSSTIVVSFLILILAFLSGISFKWDWLSPTSTYGAFQIVIGKLLIFGVIVYILVLCAKNFLSHTHNAIVNKQRQNALMTFNALADAAGSEENRDIVLTQAASCIFSPQDTGYVRHGASGYTSGTPIFGVLQQLLKDKSGSSSGS
ncbi:MAG: hypothetical protein RLO21_19140 [Nitratireductor sp.]